MNAFYSYLNFELWYPDLWESRKSRVDSLVQWIGRENKLSGENYHVPEWDEQTRRDCYQNKTGSFHDLAVEQYWQGQGILYRILDMTMHWMAVMPNTALDNREKKLPVLLVCLQADYNDHFWAMKTLAEYQAYNLMAASENLIVLYLVSNNGPDKAGTYVNVIQEAAILFPCDTNRLFLDLSVVDQSGQTLSNIPRLLLQGQDEKIIQRPDELVEKITSLAIPVINVRGNWENRGSLTRDLVMTDKYSTADFDRERLLHSETGRRMIDGIALEHRYNTIDDAGLLEHLDGLGLKFDCHWSNGERWLTLTPRSAFDEPHKKLPLFCVMQEVYCGNEHLAVTALGYFYELVKIAAQGECMLLFFVLETQDANDLLSQLIDEAALAYPVDLSRVYVTGHSHNGRFTLEFALRNFRKVAAIATLGNFMGLESPNVLGDASASVPDEKVERLSQIDLPLANFCGCCEHGGKLPLNEDGLSLKLRPGQEFGRTIRIADRISAWQRRLKGFNCPMKSEVEILAAAQSTDTVVRKLGFPVDRSEVLFADGVEHYIGDIQNNNGKVHLRMVGFDNVPHVPTPFMLDLAWSFVRRFARDLQTGETIDLY